MATESPRAHHKAPFIPAVVADWARLDEEIAEILRHQTRTQKTIETEDRHWALWADHCHATDVDPLTAPFEAFLAFTTIRGDAGQVLHPDTVDRRLASICSEIKRQGHVPAVDAPGNQETWSNHLKGLRALFAVGHPERAAQQAVAPPLRRTDLRAMLATNPFDHDPDHRLTRALAAACLDTGAALESFEDDRPAVSGDRATWGGVAFGCDHRARVRGVPWDCTTCLLIELSQVEVTASTWQRSTRRLVKVAGEEFLPGVRLCHEGGQTQLEPDPHSPIPVDVARRALLLMCGSVDGFRWLRARAWVGACWSFGQPMARGFARGPRSDVVVGDAGISCRVDGAVRLLPWTATDIAGPAECLAEYVAVRDCIVGHDGPLVVAAGRSSGWPRPAGPSDSAMSATASLDLNLLALWAGLPEHWSGLSPRLGFNDEASRAGWSPEKRQAALGHEHIQTTLQLDVPHAGRGVAAKLMGDPHA